MKGSSEKQVVLRKIRREVAKLKRYGYESVKLPDEQNADFSEKYQLLAAHHRKMRAQLIEVQELLESLPKSSMVSMEAHELLTLCETGILMDFVRYHLMNSRKDLE
jgi:hypothetical protein